MTRQTSADEDCDNISVVLEYVTTATNTWHFIFNFLYTIGFIWHINPK